MEIKRIDHVSGKGSYVVLSRLGPATSVTRFGPATLGECERFIEESAIIGIPAQACRDCGKLFPYDADADRCPACLAADQRVADALDDGISREIAYDAYIEAAPTQEERERRQRQAHCYWTSA